ARESGSGGITNGRRRLVRAHVAGDLIGQLGCGDGTGFLDVLARNHLHRLHAFSLGAREARSGDDHPLGTRLRLRAKSRDQASKWNSEANKWNSEAGKWNSEATGI